MLHLEHSGYLNDWYFLQGRRIVHTNNNSICALHLSKEALLWVSLATKAWLVGVRRRAFLVVAPLLCNSLPRCWLC